MRIPEPTFDPPFNITRASHVVLRVKDLALSRLFYTEVIGLIVSAEDDKTLYLRGVEEAAHHSLVLKATSGEPAVERIGMRVQLDRDLIKAADWYAARKLPIAWVDVPFQGKTLHVSDPEGTPIEFCVSMDIVDRLVTQVQLFRGGSAHRIDHYQLHYTNLQSGLDFYMEQGFRLSEYMVDANGQVGGIFMQRKGNPHDLVLFNGAGPRLHHVAYTSLDATTLFKACDVAGNLGFAASVERGPSRHGPGHAQFVYFRDPDGHRIEIFTTHYQMLDTELKPVRWDQDFYLQQQQWAAPPPASWINDAIEFVDVAPRPAPFHVAGKVSEVRRTG